jgi:hypothetical protein
VFQAPIFDFEPASIPTLSGHAGVFVTARLIREAIDAGKRSGEITQAATSLIYITPERDELHEVRAVFEWVRDSVRYVRDPHGIESLAAPRITLRRLSGDCDDQVALLGALLESVGYPTRLVIAAYRAPQQWEHVYLQAYAAGQWIDLDPTEREALGYAPPDPVTLWIEGER